MKNITCWLSVGAMTGFFVFSCQQPNPYRQSLATAEQIMDEHPDSAYVLLKNMPEANLSERDYADWCLLVTQAMDKQYMEHTSDSLIRIAAAYFERRGNAARQTKVYYYMGRVNQDLGETQLSQQYYLKALETGRLSGNDRQLALIHSNLGMLYTYQGVYGEALLQMDESGRLFRQLGDTVNSAYILRDMGRTYHVMDSIDLAISYYEKALADIDSFGRPSVLTELSDVLITKKSYAKAETYLREAWQSVSPNGYPLVCLVIGRLFSETGQSDSARFYLNESLKSYRLDTKAGACYYLAQLDMNEEKWKESAQFLWSYFELQDSIMKQTDVESIRKIQSLFNFKQIEEERNKALQSKINAQQVIVILVLIVLALSNMSFFLWKNNQKQKKAREDLLQYYREENQNQTDLLKQQIEEIKIKIENKSAENEKLLRRQNEKLLMDIKELELQINKIAILIQEEKLKKEKLRNTEIYQELHKKEKNKLTEEEKQKLINIIDFLWNDFRPSFKTLSSKVSDNDILMCCLIKAELKQIQVAVCMCVTNSAISNKRVSLAKKLFGEKAVKSDLDDFIFYNKIPVWV